MKFMIMNPADEGNCFGIVHEFEADSIPDAKEVAYDWLCEEGLSPGETYVLLSVAEVQTFTTRELLERSVSDRSA
jgi:hypothetical protein